MPSSLPMLCGAIASRVNLLDPPMHNAGYKAANLNFTYVAFELHDAKAAINAVRALGIRGLGVSMPFKQEVIQYLDEVDDTALKIGAVNTIVNDKGKLSGYNTDWYGCTKALEEVETIKNKIVVLLGAGGAARAVVFALQKAGAQTYIFNRTPTKAEALAEEFGARFMGSIDKLSNIAHYDILINTTSVGFQDSASSVIPKSLIKPKTVVMDLVFIPMETALLKYARAKGCTLIPGYRMLLYQAAMQFELYTEHKAPIAAMGKGLLRAIKAF
jgi:shikimate dehydrogenase